MKTKKIIALLLAVVMTASFAVSAFAASNEGYFGSDPVEDDFVPDEGEDDYYDADDYEDDGYEALPEDEPGQQDPVRLDDPSEYDENQVTPQQSTVTAPMKTAKSVADKREKNSEDTKKVYINLSEVPNSVPAKAASYALKEDPQSNTGSSGGGGCNSGTLALCAMLSAIPFFKKK